MSTTKPHASIVNVGFHTYAVVVAGVTVARFHFSRSSSKWGPQVTAWYEPAGGTRVLTRTAYFADMKRDMMSKFGGAS